MLNDVIKELQANLDKGIEAFKRDLSKVRTGRANLAILDGVRVDYYGTPTPLNQIASLNVADPRLITIKPWERSLIPEIEKAIRSAQLGLNPNSDGELVRLPMPALTQERRQELVKVVKKMAEEGKVALRAARRDANEMLKGLLKDGGITEDDERNGLKKVQETTDKAVTRRSMRSWPRRRARSSRSEPGEYTSGAAGSTIRAKRSRHCTPPHRHTIISRCQENTRPWP
jgi:ribosome recycling factor